MKLMFELMITKLIINLSIHDLKNGWSYDKC